MEREACKTARISAVAAKPRGLQLSLIMHTSRSQPDQLSDLQNSLLYTLNNICIETIFKAISDFGHKSLFSAQFTKVESTVVALPR